MSRILHVVVPYLVELVQFLLEFVTLRIMAMATEPLHPPKASAIAPLRPLLFNHSQFPEKLKEQ